MKTVLKITHNYEPFPLKKVEISPIEVAPHWDGDKVISRRVYRTAPDLELALIDWRGRQTAALGPISWYFEERIRGGKRVLLSSVNVQQIWNQWHNDGGKGVDNFSFEANFFEVGKVGGISISGLVRCGTTYRVCGHPAAGPRALTPTAGKDGNPHSVTYLGGSLLNDADETIHGHIAFDDPDGACWGGKDGSDGDDNCDS